MTAPAPTERPSVSLGTVEVDGTSWEVIQHRPGHYTVRSKNISVGLSEAQAVGAYQRRGFVAVRGQRPPWTGPSASLTRRDRKVVLVPLEALVEVVAAMFRQAPVAPPTTSPVEVPS